MNETIKEFFKVLFPLLVAILMLGLALDMLQIDCPDIDRLYTENWAEARQFARECEDTGGTVTMRPHSHSQADRPYAATITCSR